jgi:hypothetical protein
MSCVISLPPHLIDQSFPRTDYDLISVQGALTEIVERAQKGDVYIFVTDVFRLIIEEFNWEQAASSGRREVYNLLSHIFLSGQRFLVEVDCSCGTALVPHPLPDGHPESGLASVWMDEMSNALLWHDKFSHEGEFYIGIACANAFNGGSIKGYATGNTARKFPLVGPTELNGRGPIRHASAYRLPQGVQTPKVTFEQARKNIHLLGATEVIAPQKGSHYKVRFPGSRPWALDKNHPIMLERHLKELVAITGFEYPIICYSLATGTLPAKSFFYE